MTHPNAQAHVRATLTATREELHDLFTRRQALREDLRALDERIDALGKAYTSLGDALEALDPGIGDYHIDDDDTDLAEPYAGEDLSDYE